MPTAVTQKGQVTIPKRVRDEMQLVPGALVEIESDGAGGARIAKANAPVIEDPLARFRGVLDLGMSTDDYMLWLRGDPAD